MIEHQAVITLEGIRKSFSTGAESLEVLKGINASVPKGSLLVVTGESGSGKTTLLHLIAAMDTPSSGSLMVAGLDLAKASEQQLALYRNKTLGLVFQFHYLLKEFTALENVLMPARMAGLSTAQASARARDLLNEVGLSARLNHFPSQLSGGERQRVAIARSLMNDPELILADEPTGNLDEANAAMVEELLFGLTRTHGKTLVMVTHSSRLAKDGDLHWHLMGGTIRGDEIVAQEPQA